MGTDGGWALSATAAKDPIEADQALSADRLAAANIHPDTRLATDYLNHFNEVVMLIDMLPMMPDCVPDVIAWQPRSYVDHFRLSYFKGRDLAIAAYGAVDPVRRSAFERTVRDIDRSLLDLQDVITSAPMDELPLGPIADMTEMRIRPLLAHAMGLINGSPVIEQVLEDGFGAQSVVDALFE